MLLRVVIFWATLPTICSVIDRWVAIANKMAAAPRRLRSVGEDDFDNLLAFFLNN